MGYNESFKKPAHYYARINDLIFAYVDRGYVHEAHRWEQKVNRIADYPDLVALSRQAKFQLQLLNDR